MTTSVEIEIAEIERARGIERIHAERRARIESDPIMPPFIIINGVRADYDIESDTYKIESEADVTDRLRRSGVVIADTAATRHEKTHNWMKEGF